MRYVAPVMIFVYAAPYAPNFGIREILLNKVVNPTTNEAFLSLVPRPFACINLL